MSAARLLKSSSVVTLLLLLAAVTGCARYRSTSRPVQVNEQEKNERVFETNEDAVKAGIYEDFVDSSALARGETPPPSRTAAPETQPVPPVPAQETLSQPATGQIPPNVALGYRVQLGAFNDMEAAEELAGKARAVFGSRYPVYVRFYSPYWKVQAGDCASRDEAQGLREYLRRNGYPDSFVVQAGIQR